MRIPLLFGSLIALLMLVQYDLKACSRCSKKREEKNREYNTKKARRESRADRRKRRVEEFKKEVKKTHKKTKHEQNKNSDVSALAMKIDALELTLNHVTEWIHNLDKELDELDAQHLKKNYENILDSIASHGFK